MTTDPADRSKRNDPYVVPDGIIAAAVDAAYMEFCRRLGHWNPEMPGQRDALKSALRHAWEISTNLIEAAVLHNLCDDLDLRRVAASATVARFAEGSSERMMAAAQLVTLTIVTNKVRSLIEDRDPFRLVEK